MTKLYVSNTTKHHQEFLYRIPEFTKVFQQRIPAGEQVLVYEDASKDVLEYIIKQHQDTPKPFMVSASEASRHRGFIGLIYNFDAPVKEALIESAFETNQDALKAEGLEIRKDAAVALNALVGDEGGQLASVEVVEMTKQGEVDKNAINEKISVTKTRGK